MVPDRHADELHTAVHRFTVHIHFYGAVIILQIARHCSRTAVHPRTEIRMSEESIMLFVGITVQDGRFDLSADLADRTNAAVGIDLGADLDDGMVADIRRTHDRGEGHDMHILSDIDRTILRIDHHSRFDHRAFTDEDILLIQNMYARIFLRF